jgi:hypothetical protein
MAGGRDRDVSPTGEAVYRRQLEATFGECNPIVSRMSRRFFSMELSDSHDKGSQLSPRGSELPGALVAILRGCERVVYRALKLQLGFRDHVALLAVHRVLLGNGRIAAFGSPGKTTACRDRKPRWIAEAVARGVGHNRLCSACIRRLAFRLQFHDGNHRPSARRRWAQRSGRSGRCCRPLRPLRTTGYV